MDNIVELYEEALVNSEKALNDAKATHEENPSTEMHELIELLLKLNKQPSPPSNP